MALTGSAYRRAGRTIAQRRAAPTAAALGLARGVVYLAWLGLALIGALLIGGVLLGAVRASS